MSILHEKAFEEICTWCSSFSNEQLVEEIARLEHLIDCDIASKSILIDLFIALYDFLRDECVHRFAKSCGQSVEFIKQSTDK